MFVDTGSIINLTCIISWTPEPPQTTLWHHNLSTISFRGPRPGVSLIVDKSEVTTVQLIMMSARYSDSGHYTCSPDNAPQAQITLHILTGKKTLSPLIKVWRRDFCWILWKFWYCFIGPCRYYQWFLRSNKDFIFINIENTFISTKCLHNSFRKNTYTFPNQNYWKNRNKLDIVFNAFIWFKWLKLYLKVYKDKASLRKVGEEFQNSHLSNSWEKIANFI